MCPVYGDPGLQEPLWLYPGDRRFCIFSLAFSNDGKEIIGSANDGHLYVYDLEEHARTLRVRFTLNEPRRPIFRSNESETVQYISDQRPLERC